MRRASPALGRTCALCGRPLTSGRAAVTPRDLDRGPGRARSDAGLAHPDGLAGRQHSHPGNLSFVVASAGPWHTSGKWWAFDRSPWDRDEWDVGLADGSVVRLARDKHSGGWVLEGAYD